MTCGRLEGLFFFNRLPSLGFDGVKYSVKRFLGSSTLWPFVTQRLAAKGRVYTRYYVIFSYFH